MSPSAYTESALVEQSACETLESLGWLLASGIDEDFGPGSPLGRSSAREVALLSRLRAGLIRLNPDAPPAVIDRAIDELLRDRTAMSTAGANRAVYRLLTGGIPVPVRDPVTGRDETQSLRVIDWNDPHANDFLAVRQISFRGPLYTCIPDTVLFVNGLPLVVMEFKKLGIAAKQAFDDNLTSYLHPQNGAPHLFPFNAFLLVSNGAESKYGSVTADWERFFEWKRVESEDEERRVSLDVILRGVCDKRRLLDLIQHFTLFSQHKTGIAKVLAQNHQYLGVNNAITAMLQARKRGDGRAGVFWQTQGSGKSFGMVFFAEKIHRTVPGDWTFVIVTDRTELDDQIAKTFAQCDAVEDAKKCHATSAAHLRQLLSENHRYVFTLIHKFKTSDVLCDRRDVIVIADEAHRSQYDTLAMNMRAALPNAMFVAFTGTPLIAGEEKTRDLFGDYVSVYDFQQSVEDNATVPLYYENRTPELNLVNPDLNDDIYEIIDSAGLEEADESRLSRLLGQRYHLLTRDDRLDTIADDIVQHFLGRGFQGKAMVVSIDKATAVRMYDKVKAAWSAETERVRAEVGKYALDDEKRAALRERLTRLETVDMAVVVSAGQNEIEEMKARGLDIVPHRKRINESDPPLEERFKDPKDPLSIVFVCAMWLTGFDAPSCSTVYLDKPMRNHTLMQTITRANRVYPGKQSGVIVDYANVFASLEKALAIYGARGKSQTPARDKSYLADELQDVWEQLALFCSEQGVSLSAIERAETSMKRLEKAVLAANNLVAPDDRRKAFLAQARLADRIYASLKPHPRAAEFASRMSLLAVIVAEIRRVIAPEQSDIARVLEQIGQLLDRSIAGAPTLRDLPKAIDLSKIDFKALAKQFEKSQTKQLDLERLKAAIRAQLDRMIQANETRTDFREKFEAMLESYNSGSSQIEDLFRQLLAFTRDLTDEEARHVRESLSEDELVVFDLLTRPGPDLSTKERDEVKKVARQLLTRLQRILTVDWHKTSQARARVRDEIEATLDEGLPRAYSPETFKAKADAVFNHVYEHRRPAA